MSIELAGILIAILAVGAILGGLIVTSTAACGRTSGKTWRGWNRECEKT